MKQLQINFTTPEQSKQLLKLGVPADSADCYHNPIAEKPYLLTMPYSKTTWLYENNPPLPCWSAGRLIEIFERCFIDRIESHTWYNYPGKGDSIVERVIWDLVEHRDKMDYSKLCAQ